MKSKTLLKKKKKTKKNKLTSQTGGMPTADVDKVFVINAHGTQCLFDEGSYYFTMPEGLQVINFGEFGSIEQVSGMRELLPNLVINRKLRKRFITADRRYEALDYLKKHPMKRMERGDIIHEPIIKHYYKKHKGVKELDNFTTEEYRKNEKLELWNRKRENAAPDIKLYFSDPKYKGIGIYRVSKGSDIPLLSKRSNVKQKITYDSSIKFDPLLSRDPIYRDLVGSGEEWNIKLYEHLQSQGEYYIFLSELVELIKGGKLSEDPTTFENATFILHTCRAIGNYPSIYKRQPKLSLDWSGINIQNVLPRDPLHPKNKRLLAKTGITREQIEYPRQISMDAQEGLLTADVDESEYEIIDKSTLGGGRKKKRKSKRKTKRKSKKNNRMSKRKRKYKK